MQHPEILEKMTLEEKASLCSGFDYWHTAAVNHVGVPSIMLTDGPHGIRKRVEEKSKDEKMSLKGVPAICYPTACATACSWDPDLIYKMGEALGDECLKERVSVLLGPGTNIKRSPLCGRNFEYFSEDPYLAGKMSAAFINGVQSKGIGTSLKHYAVNNQETRRMTVSAVVDERTLREIYLTAYEIAVKESQPWTIMCMYNRLNGVYGAENKWLLTDVLRHDFGFEGMIVTDWGAENDRVLGLLAGQNLEMPTSNGDGNRKIYDAVKRGEISEDFLDEMVDGVVDVIMR
ncbi:MAG: glycosyl hydrolase, partial [Ruminococcus sp.]|nr:glycosyl hydrolase [Ruminococcus sp.]